MLGLTAYIIVMHRQPPDLSTVGCQDPECVPS